MTIILKILFSLLSSLFLYIFAVDANELIVEDIKELKSVNSTEIRWRKDGSLMKLVPKGEKTKPFWIDTTEVTVGQFKKFLLESNYQLDPTLWEKIQNFSFGGQHPIIYVSWADAVAYCKWSGKRLPREEEWEWAARGKLEGKMYPWGNDHRKARDYANLNGRVGKDKWEYLSPVGSFKPNGYGLYDMSGNVWEWCQDWYDDNRTRYRLLRGGSWVNDVKSLEVENRCSPAPYLRQNYIGFRCVVSTIDQ